MGTSLLSPVEPLIRAQEERLYRAMAASDVNELDALIAGDLRFVGPDGRLATKQADLEAYRTHAVVFTKLQPRALEIQPLGDIALAHATLHLEGTQLGWAFSGDYQYLRVWALREGKWKIAGGSVTPVQTVA